ncbi:M6 family metalloprotease domain-containing protein [Sulfidibacter corallicola]|uniref:M6 family metalloprotease domain-containing protein n=1 Tax=Sulfidibacter corallicola TaxID=2818388 RepID=A0A8A4THF4_SULCO|nr:M6 family metalloprotease domain-containing protein [Sulfidibacter corallicola]QTD48178.1 M6 family metalloprotease domain-containing protein [Sulfidibacter corallicola]
MNFRLSHLTFLVCLFAFLATPGLLAVPANPDGEILLGEEGNQFKARIVGDEWVNYIEKDGFTIVQNEAFANRWEYAVQSKGGVLIPSGWPVIADDVAPRGLKRHLRPAETYEVLRSKAFPTEHARANDSNPHLDPRSGMSHKYEPDLVSGPRNLLFIRVSFRDRGFNTTADDWDQIIFDDTPNVKSVKNYYDDNSFGLLEVRGVRHTQANHPNGIVTVNLNNLDHPNTGRSGMSSGDKYRIETRWVNAALAEASRFVNFANLDTNRDRELTLDEAVIYFIVAGYDASSTANVPNVWAHKWGTWNWGDVMVGNVAVNKWALNGELVNGDRRHPMGVIAHELGHLMCSLPDLYDIADVNQGMGIYSLMAAGSWGADWGEAGGTTPTNMDAWCRHIMEWSQARDGRNAGQLNFDGALAHRQTPVLFQDSRGNDEYFLVENRVPENWDLGMVSRLGRGWTGGLLIQHADTTIGSVGGNDINSSNQPHQGITVVEASSANGSLLARGGIQGHVTHLFYEGNNDRWDNDSTPNSRYWDGTNSGFGLYHISAPGAVMTASTDPNGGGGAGVTELTNGQSVDGISLASKQYRHFRIDVPANARNLKFTTSGGSGDADLYVRYRAQADEHNHHYKSTSPQSTESVAVSGPNPGTWYASVHAWNRIGNVRLGVSYELPIFSTPLTSGSPVAVSGAEHSSRFFVLEVPQGASNVTFRLAGGTGDGELFIKRGARPTKDDHTWGSERPGNDETLSLDNPQAGMYYVLVWGWSAFDGASLTGTVTSANTESGDGSLNGWGYDDYRIEVTGGTIQAEVSYSGWGNADIYLWGPGGDVVHEVRTSSNPERLVFDTNGQSGTYWIRIWNYSSSSIDYALTYSYR